MVYLYIMSACNLGRAILSVCISYGCLYIYVYSPRRQIQRKEI